MSYERPSVTDPTSAPAVIATRIVPNTPPELKHLKLLSDSQPLASHAVVDPTRDAPLESECPLRQRMLLPDSQPLASHAVTPTRDAPV